MKPVLIYVTQEMHPLLKYLPHHYTETSDAFSVIITINFQVNPLRRETIRDTAL